jgi:hypothetical protein
MIISHSRKFIFIKPMKVAGTSLEIALSKYCGPGDILTPFGQKDEQTRRDLGYTLGQNHLVPLGAQTARDWARLALLGRRRKRYLSHARACDIRASLPADIWNGYLKIAVVRNPFDYAVSRYFWEMRLLPQSQSQPQSLPPFQTWLSEQPEMLLENRRITHIDGRSVVDVMLRYEHLGADLDALSDRLGLGAPLSEDLAQLSAKTSSRPAATTPRSMFSDHPECRRLVEILCREDIDTYGYQAP